MKLLIQTFALLLMSTTFAFADAEPDEKGLASYYDDSYHGRKTRSGQVYDKTKLTAAHKSLPFGTQVRVYNPANKKSVTVTIIDRGPFIKGRIIELSRRAAQQIDLIKTQVAPVELYVDKKQNPAPAKAVATAATKAAPAKTAAPKTTSKAAPAKTDPPKKAGLVVEAKDMETGGLYKMQVLKLEAEGFGVQVAGYSDYQSVVQQLAVLQEKWFKGATVFVDELNGKPYYKVILGPMPTREEAASYCKNLKEKYNVKGAFVVDLAALAAQKAK
jgi:rare lipoprotein A